MARNTGILTYATRRRLVDGVEDLREPNVDDTAVSGHPYFPPVTDVEACPIFIPNILGHIATIEVLNQSISVVTVGIEDPAVGYEIGSVDLNPGQYGSVALSPYALRRIRVVSPPGTVVEVSPSSLLEVDVDYNPSGSLVIAVKPEIIHNVDVSAIVVDAN